MSYKILMAVMTVLSQAMLAMADGKLTADEMLGLVTALLKAFGIDVGPGDLFSFETRDGSIYIKIGRTVLDKLAVAVPME
jgi:hypothetical protein